MTVQRVFRELDSLHWGDIVYFPGSALLLENDAFIELPAST